MFNGYDISGLSSTKYQTLIEQYVAYLHCGWRHFSDSDIPSAVRLEKISLLERALRKDIHLPQNLLFKLQQNFIKENVSISLLLEPLSAWHYLAADKTPTSAAQASELLNRLLAPAARLILVLDYENPSTYHPLTSLFILLFWQEMFENNSPFLKKIKLSKRQKENRLSGLYKNAFVILSLVKNKRLKFKLALLLNFARLHTENFKNNKHYSLAWLDYTRIFLYSLVQFLFIKRKSVNNKGI